MKKETKEQSRLSVLKISLLCCPVQINEAGSYLNIRIVIFRWFPPRIEENFCVILEYSIQACLWIVEQYNGWCRSPVRSSDQTYGSLRRRLIYIDSGRNIGPVVANVTSLYWLRSKFVGVPERRFTCSHSSSISHHLALLYVSHPHQHPLQFHRDMTLLHRLPSADSTFDEVGQLSDARFLCVLTGARYSSRPIAAPVWFLLFAHGSLWGLDCTPTLFKHFVRIATVDFLYRCSTVGDLYTNINSFHFIPYRVMLVNSLSLYCLCFEEFAPW